MRTSKDNYYSGGFAEIVSTPSPLTYSFLKDWFTGNGSIGIAMKHLGLPYEPNDIPILEIHNNELVVNLETEEKTLYNHSLFSYQYREDISQIPHLVLNIKKIFYPSAWANTVKILLLQSRWISDQEKFVRLAKQFVDEIPSTIQSTDIQELDILFRDKIWPNVLAVGLLSEFYDQINKKNHFLYTKSNDTDWFLRSITDQYAVKQQNLSFEEYLHRYGVRADKDYELAEPRWYEIPEVIKKRIEEAVETKKNNDTQHVSSYTKSTRENIIAHDLQLLRSEAKRKALLHIDCLRQAILEKTKPIHDISTITKEELLNGNFSADQIKNTKQGSSERIQENVLTKGKGIAVSPGTIVGTVSNIRTNDEPIKPYTIGVFSNASPQFANQYSKCIGLIFLKGGRTSHGAIVARELGIPALIDSKLSGIPDDSTIQINGTTGEWNIE